MPHIVTRASATDAPELAHASTYCPYGIEGSVAAKPCPTGSWNHTHASLPYTEYALSIEAFTERLVLCAAKNAAVASPIAATVTAFRPLRRPKLRIPMAGTRGRFLDRCMKPTMRP